MADGAELEIDVDAFAREGRRIVDRYVSAGSEAVKGATKRLERRLEDVTRSAVPGQLWKAWASRFYPNQRSNAAGSVYVKGGERTRGAIAFWTRPGTIRGKSEQYLAIPLPAAGPRGKDRNLTPGEWERAHGIRLRFVYRQGRPSLLVADNAVLKGRSGAADRNARSRRQSGRGGATVPIFVLLPLIQFRNTVAVEPIVRAAEADLVQDFLSRTRSN